jgi:hypothetical protein
VKSSGTTDSDLSPITDGGLTVLSLPNSWRVKSMLHKDLAPPKGVFHYHILKPPRWAHRRFGRQLVTSCGPFVTKTGAKPLDCRVLVATARKDEYLQ